MKNIFWVIAVIVVVLLGDRAGGWILGKITLESQFRYSRLYQDEANCEVLLIGNSRGLIFYQPYIEERTGLTTCNLSYNGMPMDLAAALIKDHIDINGAPKLLVLDISLIDKRMDARLVTGFNLYTPYSPRLSQLLKSTYPESFYGGQVSHLYRYNSEVFQRALYYWKKSDKHWLLDRVISPTMQADIVNQQPFLYDYTDGMLKDLEGVVNYAQGLGVKVELVVNPYYPPFAEKIGNLAALKSAVTNSTGLKVHDYANSIQETEGFGDYQHLNKKGARAYLDRLIDDGILKIEQLGFSE